MLTAITCAPVTRTIRNIRSEFEVGPDDGLPERSVIDCDNLSTVPKDRLYRAPLGHLGLTERVKLDHALSYALDIQYSRSPDARPCSGIAPVEVEGV